MHRLLVSAAATILLCFGIAATTAAETERPRLVLQITVDQLRGDMLPRYRDAFGAGGFRRLMERGVWYANANYGSGNTFTSTGHAVLVTGADTAEHGMVGNHWFDRSLGKRISCVYDAEYGISPRNLGSSTIGDEIVDASAGHARAYAVSGKDRSAVIPAGRRGRPYWYSDRTGQFGNSPYYGATLPGWVRAWNSAHPADRYRGRVWTASEMPDSARTYSDKANPQARPFTTLGRSFPHALPDKENANFFAGLSETPFLDELTLNFARELVTQEKLGRGATTDYLSISLAAVDFVGHAYGPNSREYADALVKLDMWLADFLTFVDQYAGPGRTLMVLSADHGVDDIPEVHSAAGYDASRLYPDKLVEQMNRALAKRFGGKEGLVAAFVPPGLYLDRAKIAEAKLDSTVVERVLADAMRAVPGVAYAITRSDMLAGRVPPGDLMRRMLRGFHPVRSGDVVIVQRQFWYLYDDADCCAAMHGSPYSYDTFVPILFSGPGIAAARVVRDVEPASIAPTIAAILGIKRPSGSSAPVLTEVVPGH